MCVSSSRQASLSSSRGHREIVSDRPPLDDTAAANRRQTTIGVMQQQRKMPVPVTADHAEKLAATTERSDGDAGLRRLTYSPEKPASAAAPQGSHLVTALGDSTPRSIQTHASSNRESSVVVAQAARAPLLPSADHNCAVVKSSAGALTHDKKLPGGGLVGRKKQSCVTSRPPPVPPTSGRSKSQVTAAKKQTLVPTLLFFRFYCNCVYCKKNISYTYSTRCLQCVYRFFVHEYDTCSYILMEHSAPSIRCGACFQRAASSIRRRQQDVTDVTVVDWCTAAAAAEASAKEAASLHLRPVAHRFRSQHRGGGQATDVTHMRDVSCSSRSRANWQCREVNYRRSYSKIDNSHRSEMYC